MKSRIKGGLYAIKGAFQLLRQEQSIQVQCGIAILISIIGFCVGISPTEWLFQTLAIGLVMAIEGANTAIEELADFIHPDYHRHIGKIKDLAAGAVFIAALTAVVVGLMIYIPYFF